MTVDQVLFGYYIIPRNPGLPLEVVVNPEGNEARSLKRFTSLLSQLHASTLWLTFVL